tara:strand:+ start:329 stop:556 length:228 start_codon:yes stop_codon:yes gene_type:complete
MLFRPNRLGYIYLSWRFIVTKSYDNNHIFIVIWPKMLLAHGVFFPVPKKLLVVWQGQMGRLLMLEVNSKHQKTAT